MSEEYYINTFNCEVVSDNLFFVSSDMNLVLKYSLSKDEVILLPPPKGNMFEMGLYGNVAAFDGCVYLVPFNYGNIWKYGGENGWEEIPVPGSANKRRFLGAVLVEHYIYLLGFGRKEIYKFNILTYQITELNINNKLEVSEIGDEGFLGSDYEIIDGRIFVPVMCANKILEIVPETDSINVINVPSRSNGYSGIIYDGDGFWLSPRKGRYFVHYLLNGKIEEYELPNEYKSDEMYFGGVYKEGNYIVFNAFNGKNLKFRAESPNEYETFEPSIYYYKKLKNNGKVLHERNGQTYYIDDNGDRKILNLSMSRTDKLEYIGKYMDKKMILTETYFFSLSEYLKVVEYYL